MIQRRALAIALVALTAASAACKTSERPAPTSGSAVAGSGSGSATGSAIAIGSGTDLGSAVPKPGDLITRPFFYKVEKDGKTSHLIGTWHIGIDGEKQMPKVVWQAFDAATAFAMEVDPADPAGLTAFKRTDGRTLEAELGPEYWAKLEAQVGPLAAAMKQMKPAAAVMLLQFKDMPQTMMDLAFVTKAKAARKRLVFLEQAQVQIRLLDRWIDLRVLKATIDDTSGTKAKLDAALAVYMVGDDAALVSMAIDRDGMKDAGFTDTEIDQAIDQMLYDRNAAWIPALEELFGKGGAFVAVGAGHLIGSKSVVELLAAKGYTVTRIGG